MAFKTKDISGLRREANLSVVPVWGGQGTAEKLPVPHNGTTDTTYRKPASRLTTRSDSPADRTVPSPQGAVFLSLVLPRSHLRVHCLQPHGGGYGTDRNRVEISFLAPQNRTDPVVDRPLPSDWWLLPAVLVGSTVWTALIWKGLHMALH